jgi:hypothetical protein
MMEIYIYLITVEKDFHFLWKVMREILKDFLTLLRLNQWKEFILQMFYKMDIKRH